jgi:hypothetical protein
VNDDPEPLDSIYDALDRGEADEALALARHALASGGEDDPVLHFLAGVARLELGDPERAAGDLDRAVALDPEDPEFRATRALARFRACHFSAADEDSRRALALDPDSPDAHHVRALLAERRRSLLPGPAPPRRGRVPPGARSRGRGPRPSLPRAPRPGDRHRGRRAGRRALDRRDAAARSGSAPRPVRRGTARWGHGARARRRDAAANLERHAADGDLAEEIRVTLYHELGHYLGMDEEDLERLGYG